MTLESFKKQGWYCELNVGQSASDNLMDLAFAKHCRDMFLKARSESMYDSKNGNTSS